MSRSSGPAAGGPAPLPPPPHPSGAPSARDPRRAGPAATSPSSWTATAAGPTAAACRGPRGTRPGRRLCSTSSPGPSSSGVGHVSAYAFSTENWKRSPEEVALPHGLQPGRHPAPPRPDALLGRPGPLGRAPAAAVAQRHRRAAARRGADPRQHRLHPDDVRELRRPGRDRRRGHRHRGQGEGGDADPPRDRRGSCSPSTSTSRTCPTSTCSGGCPASSGRSNFLLWQSAYAELVFTDELWPDVDRRSLWRACETYARRDRRWGGRRWTRSTGGDGRARATSSRRQSAQPGQVPVISTVCDGVDEAVVAGRRGRPAARPAGTPPRRCGRRRGRPGGGGGPVLQRRYSRLAVLAPGGRRPGRPRRGPAATGRPSPGRCGRPRRAGSRAGPAR